MATFWNILIELSILSFLALIYYLYQKRRIQSFYNEKRIQFLNDLVTYIGQRSEFGALLSRLQKMQTNQDDYFTSVELESICSQILDETLKEKLLDSFEFLVKN